MYKRKDSYYLQAKKEGYRSRAAYKLTEIARKESVVRPGIVVDAGAAPGGWSQIPLSMVGKKGKVSRRHPADGAAARKLPLLPGGRSFLPARKDPDLGGRRRHVSDAAPNTSGTFTDQARSADLVRVVFSLRKTLKEGGIFLAKIRGQEADAVQGAEGELDGAPDPPCRDPEGIFRIISAGPGSKGAKP